MTIKNNNTMFCIVLLLVNYLVATYFNLKISAIKIFFIHIFLFSLSTLSIYLQKIIAKKKNNTPSYFLTVNFFRISVCTVFLLPTIITYNKLDNTYIYNFFMTYFIYLFLEMRFALKNKK